MLDSILIEDTRDENLHIFPTNLVKPLSGPKAIGQHIAAVEPNAMGFAAQHNDFVDCFVNIISIHEKSRLFRKNIEEIAESFSFVVMRHDPRVRLCSINGDAEGVACERVGCSRATCNVGRACGQDSSLYTMGP